MLNATETVICNLSKFYWCSKDCSFSCNHNLHSRCQECEDREKEVSFYSQLLCNDVNGIFSLTLV